MRVKEGEENNEKLIMWGDAMGRGALSISCAMGCWIAET
jgi:hypothetical protein